MKRIGLFLVMAGIGLRVSAQSAVSDTTKFSVNKYQITSFLNLMHIAGLDSVYADKPITIFAPDNKAFEKLPAGMLDSLSKPGNKAALITLINDHIVYGRLTAKDISAMVRAEAPHQQYVFGAMAGNHLITVINANRNIVFLNKNGEENVIKQFDIPYRNFLLFIISSVILPEK